MPAVSRDREVKRTNSEDDSLEIEVNATLKSDNEPRPYNPQIFDTLFKMKSLPTLMNNLPQISNNEAVEVLRNIEPRIASEGQPPQFMLAQPLQQQPQHLLQNFTT